MPNTPPKSSRDSGPGPNSDVLFRVYSNFAGIGTDVADMIVECAVEPVRMKTLLERLKIPSSGTDLDSQLKALSMFATEVGETQFIMKLRHEVWKTIRATEKIRSESKMRAIAVEPVVEHAAVARADSDDPRPGRVRAHVSVTSGDYTGPDRRRLVGDRRSKHDRRGYPEGMGMDKRSGRDRRKRPHGRRKNDGDPLM